MNEAISPDRLQREHGDVDALTKDIQEVSDRLFRGAFQSPEEFAEEIIRIDSALAAIQVRNLDGMGMQKIAFFGTSVEWGNMVSQSHDFQRHSDRCRLAMSNLAGRLARLHSDAIGELVRRSDPTVMSAALEYRSRLLGAADADAHAG